MNIHAILTLARQGRPDLAAIHLGASGFSGQPLKIIVRYRYADGERATVGRLKRLYEHNRHQAEAAYCCE